MKPSGNPPEIEIEVQIDAPFSDRLRTGLFTRAAAVALAYEGAGGPAELTVVVTGDARLQQLNRSYRGVDAPTDVLAFGNETTEGFVSQPEAPCYVGDVIISFQRAEAQAKSAGHAVEAELQLLTVHGVLHLLGHDHAEPDEKAAMWTAQAALLRELGASVADPTPEIDGPPNR